MLTPDILRELLELLTPLATGGSGILGLHTQVVLAFGTHDLLGRITMGGNAQEYISELLKTLDEYGETSPGTRALWQFMSHLKTQVGIDKQTRIDALKPILNAPPLPTIHTASSAPRVFLSYARSDGEGFAHGLRGSLERAGIPLWQDRVGMEGGRDWWLQITDAIEKVQFMVLVMTPNAMKSEVVRKEWRYARQHGVCVYPVKGAADLDFASLPKWMRDSHFYDLGFDVDHCEQGAEWGKFLVDLQGVCKTPRVPFMVEDMPSDFVPRPEEFEALKGKLLGRDGTEPVAITAALKGAGGYGKTTLAKALCHDGDIQTAFDDGILWVTLGEKVENLYEKVDGLIFALTGAKSNAPTLETATAKLVELFTDRDLLLVIDDVWDQVHLRPFLQGGKGCARLITTRNSDTLPSHVEEQTVDAMKPDEASQLLAAGIAVNDPTLHRAFLNLAGALGEWALLLKLANGVIRERIKRGETPAQALAYAQRTYEKRGVLGFDGRNPSERNQAAQLSLGISFDLLHEDEKQRFAELAIFPEDLNIPLVTLERLWTAAGLDDLDAEHLCETLYRYSLLLNFDLKARTIRLHDVVRKYLRDTHQGEIAAWNSRFLDAYGVKAWADLPQNEPYLWDQLAYHLIEAGRGEELRAALLDYRYLQAKLNATEVNALIADGDALLGATSPGQNADAISLVRSALSMSAHWLMQDKSVWGGQLVGRLASHRQTTPAIRLLTDAITNHVLGIYPTHLNNEYPTHQQAGGALLRTLTGHEDVVNSALYSPDGRFIISASDDKTVRVWEASSGVLIRSLQGHIDSVRSAVYSPNGRRIVSASRDRTIRLWDTESGAPLHTFTGHKEYVRSAAYSPDGRCVVSASDDWIVRVWDTENGNLLRTLTGHEGGVNRVAYSPDGRCVVSASSDRTIRVWDTESGAHLHTLTGHEDGVNSANYSPDGRWITSASHDHTVRVWDANSGVLLRTLTGHTSSVRSAVYSPDGRCIVSASFDHTVRVWDANSGALLNTLTGHTSSVRSAVYSPDGHCIVSASRDRTVRVWDAMHKGLLRALKGHQDIVLSVGYSPNGHCVISTSGDKTVQVWDAMSGTPLSILEGHTREVYGAVYSPDGRCIVSASRDRTVRVWDAASGTLLHTLQGHEGGANSVVYSPNGRHIASASDDKTIRVWDAESGALLLTFTGHEHVVTSTVYSPDGRYIASASRDRTVRVWDAESGAPLLILTGHKGDVISAGYSPDGSFIASVSWDKTVRVWETKSGRMLATFPNTPDGRTALLEDFPQVTHVGGHTQRHPAGQTLDFDGQMLWVRRARVTYTSYSDSRIVCATWSPDGEHLVAGDAAGRVLFLRWTGAEAQLTEAGIKTQQDR